MPRFQIVTDSSALVGNLLTSDDLPVTIIPNTPTANPRAAARRAPPADGHGLQSPTADAYAEVFIRLSRRTDGILCITPSRQLSAHWEHAHLAMTQIAGACPVHIFDSQTLSGAQTLITLQAARLLCTLPGLDAVERALRNALQHNYTLMFVEHVELLARSGILNPQHTLLSTMLGVKPLVTAENGILTAVEKTRSRLQALDRLYEFAAEFGQHAHIIIQHDHESADTAARLHERLQDELQGQTDIFVYNSALSALVGTGAVAIAIQDSVIEQEN
jgi:DegV family protein with EDD domain